MSSWAWASLRPALVGSLAMLSAMYAGASDPVCLLVGIAVVIRSVPFGELS